MIEAYKPRPLQKVKDFPDFRRDEKTGMIVNINKRKTAERMEQAQRDLELQDLKEEVSGIKGMLNKILEKVSNA
jgi:hypothetical protein